MSDRIDLAHQLRRGVLITVGLAIAACLALGLRPARADDRLRVVTKEIEPFVVMDGDRLTGFSIDIWEEVAQLYDVEYEWIVVDSVVEQLEAVADGRAEVAIAAITMTSDREESVDFSHPYFRSGLRILVKSNEAGTLERLASVLLSPRLLGLYAFIVLLLIVIGFAAWLVERSRNDHFPQEAKSGIWEGVWWAAATLTTVGYGDRTVTGTMGRVLGLIWMFAGIFLVANFTAVVTAELTMSRQDSVINGVEDLRDVRVATVGGTTSSEYLSTEGIWYTAVESVEDAMAMLSEGRVDAIVYDGPVLQYEQARLGDPSLQFAGEILQPENYALALDLDSSHRREINIALLELWENGTHAELLKKWSITER